MRVETMQVIRELSALDAHPLRKHVLRRGIADPDVHYPQDDDPRSFHLGAYDGDRLVGVASFTPAPTPYREGAAAWQLRGMAVDDPQQRGGTGGRIIEEAVARVRAEG